MDRQGRRSQIRSAAWHCEPRSTAILPSTAPTKQVYQPTQWNTFRIELKGDHLKVTANGEVIQDVDLSKQDQTVKRHDGNPAPPIQDRPRRGHIGFQCLNRDDVPVQIRGARIKA